MHHQRWASSKKNKSDEHKTDKDDEDDDTETSYKKKVLSIKKIKTSKDKIEQPELAKHKLMFIPPIGSSVIMNGQSGSGKSTLLANLLTLPQFYGKSKNKPHGWFDKIFIFSPTANGDDVQKSLNIPKNHVFTDLDEEDVECLDFILDSQQDKIDAAGGAHKVPQFAIIFDDVIGNHKFMNSKAFKRCFYQVRHVNCTTFICTQQYKRVPKLCRLQANFVFFFESSQSEVEALVEDFAPPTMSKKNFMSMVDHATEDDYAFLTINKKVEWKHRFRQNLDEIIDYKNFDFDEHKSMSHTDKDSHFSETIEENVADEQANSKRRKR